MQQITESLILFRATCEADKAIFLAVSSSHIIITHADYGGRRGYKTFESVCLSVYLSASPQHNSKTNDPKVFKLGIGNDLGMF